MATAKGAAVCTFVGAAAAAAVAAFAGDGAVGAACSADGRSCSHELSKANATLLACLCKLKWLMQYSFMCVQFCLCTCCYSVQVHGIFLRHMTYHVTSCYWHYCLARCTWSCCTLDAVRGFVGYISHADSRPTDQFSGAQQTTRKSHRSRNKLDAHLLFQLN